MEMSWFLIERLPGLETSPFPNGPVPGHPPAVSKQPLETREGTEEGEGDWQSTRRTRWTRWTKWNRTDVESKRGQHERNVPRPRLYRSDFIPSIIRRSPVTFDS